MDIYRRSTVHFVHKIVLWNFQKKKKVIPNGKKHCYLISMITKPKYLTCIRWRSALMDNSCRPFIGVTICWWCCCCLAVKTLFNGECFINSSKSSSFNGDVFKLIKFADEISKLVVVKRKPFSKSNGLFWQLNDSERANELLNAETFAGWLPRSFFGMRTSLLCKRVSIIKNVFFFNLYTAIASEHRNKTTTNEQMCV